VKAFYCSVDTDDYYPDRPSADGADGGERAAIDPAWDLGYLGTYSTDRQPSLTSLMLEPARTLSRCRFVVAGAQYPDGIAWPGNVTRITHLPPRDHRTFYNAQRYTLNLTRADMVRAGWSPSVRLFEAAACGTPIVSDYWEGLEEFFEPGRDIFIARSAKDTAAYLHDIPEPERVQVGMRARARVLERHSAAHRAEELVAYAGEAWR
jgi:spore maturation protein CgeB